MNKFIVFVFLLFGFQSFAEVPEYAFIANFSIDSVISNSDISSGKAQVAIHVKNNNFSGGDEILFGYGDGNLTAHLNDENSFKFSLKSGGYSFQFYPISIDGYQEITTNYIEVNSQTTTYISLDFKYAMEVPVELKKPVIYLYPPKEMDVSVTVNPVGEMSFTYPEYTGKWECTATPSGEIHVGKNTYNYLFWESDQLVNPEKLRETPSIVVSKDDLVGFLEVSLDKFGFNSKEKMDFITFWAPQMIKHEATEIRFILNEACSQFAKLEISPKPDNLLRFYMVWNESTASNVPSTANFNTLKPSRDGFTVLEWGGIEITPSSNLGLVETAE